MHESPYQREPGYAERYRDRRFATGTGAATDRRERRALRALLRRAHDELPWPEGPWLDAPSGAGRLSDELPAPVVRADRDPAMVRAAGPDLWRCCASVHALPFRDDAFAGVLCMRLVQHLRDGPERVRVFSELARVSRGPIVVSFFDSTSLQHLRRRLGGLRGKRRSGRFAVPRRTFRDELQQAGLEVVAMRALRRFFGEQTLVLCRPTHARDFG